MAACAAVQPLRAAPQQQPRPRELRRQRQAARRGAALQPRANLMTRHYDTAVAVNAEALARKEGKELRKPRSLGVKDLRDDSEKDIHMRFTLDLSDHLSAFPGRTLSVDINQSRA